MLFGLRCVNRFTNVFTIKMNISFQFKNLTRIFRKMHKLEIIGADKLHPDCEESCVEMLNVDIKINVTFHISTYAGCSLSAPINDF